MDSPASRYSMSVWTGTLVPRKTGVPPMVSGSETITKVLIFILSRPKWVFPVTAAPSSVVMYPNFAANQVLHPTVGHADCLELGGYTKGTHKGDRFVFWHSTMSNKRS